MIWHETEELLVLLRVRFLLPAPSSDQEPRAKRDRGQRDGHDHKDPESRRDSKSCSGAGFKDEQVHA
jgi:hypothetical protein